MPANWLWLTWLLWLGQGLYGWHNQYMFGKLIREQRRKLARDRIYEPCVAIILPIKGVGPRTGQTLDALLNQNYPKYRLIVCVESEDDPACALVRERHDASVQCVVAGRVEQGGQKVHNQLAGLAALRDRDELIVFADGDIEPSAGWLEALVHPLGKQDVAASTGYRWMLPQSETPSRATSIACVINAAVATMLCKSRWVRAWGGSMAMRRETLEQVRLTDYWHGALSDDYQFTRAVRRAKLGRLYFASGALVQGSVEFTWASFREFALRQYRITRVHAPGLWAMGLAVVALYLWGWVASLAALVMGQAWALPVIVAMVLMDLRRGTLRGRWVGALYDTETVERWHRPGWWDRWATVVWMAVNFMMLLGSAWGRTITWAGRRYRMRSPQRIEELDTDDAGAQKS